MSFLVSGCQFPVKLLIGSPQRIPGAGTKGKGKREKKLEREGNVIEGFPEENRLRSFTSFSMAKTVLW
ncbi:MAG: hypothetical protein FJ135_15525 [Deltaproteobacteria bacterium]|nr:hypothetical protein [Deltaproteobacteria bacterium]